MAVPKGVTGVFLQLCLTTVLLTPSGSIRAGQPQWQTYTSFRDVRQTRYLHDTLWVATSGGLLAITDPDQPGRVFDNLSGLGTTDITDIIEDTDGQKWVTGLGRLIRFSSESPKQFLFEREGSLLPLYCVVDDGDNLWIGADIGLVLFSKIHDGGQIQDSYGRFGNLSAAPRVSDIALAGDSIWIATSAGLAVADKSSPLLLKSPAAWAGFGVDEYPELGAQNVVSVAWFEGALYVATVQGMFRLDRSSGDTSFTPMPIAGNRSVFDLKIETDSLFFYYNLGLGVVKDSTFASLPTAGLPSAPFTGANTGAYRWVGLLGGGIYRSAGGDFVEYSYTGTPGNEVSDVTVNDEGLVTAGFSLRQAASYDGESWHIYDNNYAGGTRNVVSDRDGNTWIGTWGGGLWYITDDSAVNFNETNSTLRGYQDFPTYVIVRGVASEGRYVYAASYRAVNKYPLAIGDLTELDSPAGWDSLGLAEGLTNELVNTLDCHDGQVAVGTLGNGVFVCYLGDDPFDASRRYCRHYTVDSGLASNNIRAVQYAPDGNLWVGTDRGLARWDLDRFVEVVPPEGVGPVITALIFDDRQNLWIGSERTGLARVDGATGEATVYTTRNSGLVSDNVTSITLHPVNADLYVGTPAGISVLRSGVSRITSSLKQVVAFPNPFVIRSDADSLKFNYSRIGTVRLFTIAGELVAEFPVNTPWNGRNQRGERVSSGVYVYVLTDRDGDVGRGKVLVIREK